MKHILEFKMYESIDNEGFTDEEIDRLKGNDFEIKDMTHAHKILKLTRGKEVYVEISKHHRSGVKSYEMNIYPDSKKEKLITNFKTLSDFKRCISAVMDFRNRDLHQSASRGVGFKFK